MTAGGCFVLSWLVSVLCVAKVVHAVDIDGCAGGDSPCGIFKDLDDVGGVMALHASEPVSKLKSLNMMAEDHEVGNFRPTPLPLTTLPGTNILFPKTNDSKTNATSLDEPRARALNFTMQESHDANNLSNSTNRDEFDLSDVTIRDGEDESLEKMASPKILVPVKGEVGHTHNISTSGVCEKGGLTYENGEKLELGCDSICTCNWGHMECEDRCTGPFFRKGKRIDDPLCSEKFTEDPCCSVMICASDTETEPLEICSHDNETYHRGDSFKRGCSEVCSCEIAGKISCKPRCPLAKRTSDSCVEITDPHDSCCKQILCDVTLDDHQDQEKDETKKPDKHRIVAAIQSNSSFITLNIEPEFDDHDSNLPIVEVSNDKTKWNYYQLFPKGELFVKEHYKYARLENTEEVIDVKSQNDKDKEKVRINKQVAKGEPNTKIDYNKVCHYKGKSFHSAEEFNDGCELLCACQKGEMRCLKLECPTYFGVDVLDPTCVEWETIPPNFKPSAPNCCPERVRCKNNGSCSHEGKSYKNWEQLPVNVTGCEKRCYCEMGKVECQNTCPPVPALPPSNLACPPREASLQHVSDDDCCMYWVCVNPKDQASTTKPDKTGLNQTRTAEGMQPFKLFGPLTAYANKTAGSDSKVDRHASHLAKEESPLTTRNTSSLHNLLKGIVTSPQKPQNVIVPILHPSEHEISINGQSNSHDILQLLQAHPEISNLSSGSALEIVHSVQAKPNFSPHIKGISSLQPIILNSNQKSSFEPIGHLSSDISLEQILQELHKNINPHGQGPLVSFPHVPPYIAYDLDTTPNKAANNNTGARPKDAFNNHYPEDISFDQHRNDISVHSLQAIDPYTIRLAFMVPPVIVGLHGRVEVRYTFKNTDDTNSWDLQVFAPPNDLIATSSLEFDLLELVPDKEYKIKITITLRDLHNTPSSKTYKIRTPKEVKTTTTTTALPPQIPIEPDLEIYDINATWVTVTWRKFTEYELQFIDGVQLRYREIDGKIYTATPLIHRAVTVYTIENLRSNTKYEIGIFFIPFPGQHTELNAEHMLQFTTANLVDTYGFGVTLDISQIKSTSVDISWSGVPYPEDKYVNIYRAIYQSDSGKEDRSTFKIAKRDSPAKTVIVDLKPGTRYRLWLEVYLTNGKITSSNVQDFITKPRAAPALGSSSQDKVSRAEVVDGARNDYYGPLVVVAILAAIAIMSTAILLLILVRRHNQHKAAITPPSTRVSQSAYDNPTYKVEIQQETMGL